MAILFEQYVKTDVPAFITEVKRVAARLLINPEWLMAVMFKESKINPAAVNPRSGATGLIQFMPKTANSLGTTVQRLKTMTGVQQMKFVEKYFYPYRGRIKSYEDLYMITFFPAAIGKPDEWVLRTSALSAETIAKANQVVDLNKDGRITVGEFKKYASNGFDSNIYMRLLKKNLQI